MKITTCCCNLSCCISDASHICEKAFSEKLSTMGLTIPEHEREHFEDILGSGGIFRRLVKRSEGTQAGTPLVLCGSAQIKL
jgi:hypothetical protein